jgi:hypothetical protein
MSLSSNYSVTFAEATTFLYPNGAYPSGQDNKCITKAEALSYFYVQSSYLSGYASNQLVKYQDLVAQTTVTIQLYGRGRTSPNQPVGFWYKVGDNSPVRKILTTISGTSTYSNLGTFNIPSGALLYLGTTNSSNTSVQFGMGQNSGIYTGYCGITTAPYGPDAPTSNTTYYINVNTNAGNSPVTC